MKNKKFNFIILILLIAALISPCFAEEHSADMSKSDKAKPLSQGLKDINKMKFDPLKFHVPKVGKEVERVVLQNGMILYLLEDHSLPVVKINALIRTGSGYEKKDQYGIAGLTGSMMRKGGTKNFSPEQLNDELEQMAATIETSIDVESGSAYLEVTSSQLDKGLKLYSEVLRYPAFNDKELEHSKSQIKESLRRRNDSVRTIGKLELNNRIYPDYSYGWEYEWPIIKKITREDLIAWHKRFYHPNNIMLAVVGDFKKEDVIKKLNSIFGDWPKAELNLPIIGNQELKYNPGIFYVDKNVEQTLVLMGHLGLKRDDPDRYAMLVMNYILGGGGFNSYLMERVRSDEGLAYSVGSYAYLDRRTYGTFYAYTSTRNDAAVKAVGLIFEQFNRIREKPVTQKELDWAKNAIVNAFVFEFDNSFSQTSNLMSLEYNKMPADFYEKYVDNIRKVTVKDVQQVAQKHVHPDKLTVIMIGDTKKLDKPLSTLGKDVHKIELKEFKED